MNLFSKNIVLIYLMKILGFFCDRCCYLYITFMNAIADPQ